MTQQFIHVRVDPVLKKDAEKVLGSLGLTMTKGIHLFLNSVIRNKGLPFEVKQSREDLLGDRSRLEQLRRSGRQSWEKSFTWERVALEYEGVYRKLLSS